MRRSEMPGAWWRASALVLLLGTAATASELSGVPRILDGDTVELGTTKVRLRGIDAPETDQLCLDARGKRWACGIEARDRLQKHAGAKAWTCAVSGLDPFRRSLASCRAGAEDIERWMVRNGWALSFIRYSHAYDTDEAFARGARAGLWAGSFVAPWDWRARNASTIILGAVSIPRSAQRMLLGTEVAAEAPSPGCAIKGNVNRAGVCIFHVPGGRFYGKVNMTLGKRWFCSEHEAEAAGCRKSKQ